jgi:signal transduction histidine kinase
MRPRSLLSRLGTGREAAYSLLVPLPGVLCGVVLLVLLAVSLVTSITQIGLVLLIGVLTVARGTGALHRGLLRWPLGEHVPAPPRRQRPTGRGPMAALRATLTDSDGWRAAAFTVAYVPLGLLLFVVGVGLRLFGTVILVYPVWRQGVDFGEKDGLSLFGFWLDTWPRSLIASVLGLALLAFSGWSTSGLIAFVVRPMARALLGPGRLADRVHVLEETRALAVQDSAVTLRRIERDLHDGAQARLVAVAMALAGAKEQLAAAPEVSPQLTRGRELVDSALANSRTGIGELRDLVRGIHPPDLNEGLDVALEALAQRAALPVTTRVDLPSRPPEALESIGYFCAAELVANAARHAGAQRAELAAHIEDGALHLSVHDDGHGGARPRTGRRTGSGGTGLAGLAERVSTVDGRLLIDSPEGGPTTVTAVLPLPKSPSLEPS